MESGRKRPAVALPGEESGKRLALAIALISAAALAYQLLLMRWLAIAHWHPFAVTIISLALLGHGASGSALCLWLRARPPSWLPRRFDAAFATCALAFAVSAVLALLLARRLPFNGLELVWDPRQWLWLSALYLTLAVPFFFAASCFGLAFTRHGDRIALLYGADLGGAGVGALAALALSYLPVGRALLLAALCAALAAALATPRVVVRVVALAVMAALLALWPTQWLTPLPNEFKGLSRALLMPQARVIARRDGPYGAIAVLASPQVPLRQAPGLSLAWTQPLPPQLGVYVDGDGPAVIVRNDGRAQDWLGALTSALPYALQRPDAVLVLGADGGMEVLQALTLGARRVDAVVLDPLRLRLVRDDYARYAGGLYRDRRVHVFVAEPRAFVRASARRYDLIVLAGSESFASGGAGVQATAEQYAATVEAVRDYLAHLSDDGRLAITRWSKQPPRDELKLLTTALAALRDTRATAPATRIVAIRNWDASTWLIARRPFTATETAAVLAFAQRWGFDAVQVPGVDAAMRERLHALDPPWLYAGADALLSPRAHAFVRDYPFAIAPARDDRPYFGHFFRWRSLPELWRLRGQGSAALLDSGYLLLVAALVQALPLALLLVLWPLRALPKPAVAAMAFPRARAGLYFLALGLAFLLIEIATLSRLTLLVGHPLLAAALGLAGFLLFAGGGSMHAQAWLQRNATGDDALLARRIHRAVHAIVFGLLWQFGVFALTFTAAAGWPLWTHALLGLVGIAPLAFAMGQPFALGLARLVRSAPAFVPWAWGLNGCASVLAALLALLLAMAFGLRATLLVALALYLLAAWVWPARVQPDGRQEGCHVRG